MKSTFKLTTAAILVAASLSACNDNNKANIDPKPVSETSQVLTAKDAGNSLHDQGGVWGGCLLLT